MDEIVNTEEQVAWNLASQLLMEIGNLLNHANSHFLNGRIDLAFYNLKAVKFRIIQNLKPEERKKFTEIEKDLAKEIEEDEEESTIKISNKGEVLFEKYNELLMDSLEKYGYTIKKQEDRTQI
jgi:uncharacterized ubiquitin-like protein YukD